MALEHPYLVYGRYATDSFLINVETNEKIILHSAEKLDDDFCENGHFKVAISYPFAVSAIFEGSYSSFLIYNIEEKEMFVHNSSNWDLVNEFSGLPDDFRVDEIVIEENKVIINPLYESVIIDWETKEVLKRQKLKKLIKKTSSSDFKLELFDYDFLIEFDATTEMIEKYPFLSRFIDNYLKNCFHFPVSDTWYVNRDHPSFQKQKKELESHLQNLIHNKND